jgi:hypothetical protein
MKWVEFDTITENYFFRLQSDEKYDIITGERKYNERGVPDAGRSFDSVFVSSAFRGGII